MFFTLNLIDISHEQSEFSRSYLTEVLENEQLVYFQVFKQRICKLT